ncbi:MAG: late competence development ComFB family protein [SAR324 cluster bacterium]|nr:late competence development ComFB family protein [SAR324 cluster bacterium]
MDHPEKYIINGHSLESVRNRNEIIVIEAMREILPTEAHISNCSLCIEDAYALSLSRIPPTYTHKGSIVLKPEYSKEEIFEVVQNVVRIIADKPKHT